jgi:hypothetical protein
VPGITIGAIAISPGTCFLIFSPFASDKEAAGKGVVSCHGNLSALPFYEYELWSE